jgi:phosphate starvation-inducible PhoH-like protein|tara:strand:- start:161 stop:997 length:837 start_codon:yes stop_codon:yes gene_type:complete
MSSKAKVKTITKVVSTQDCQNKRQALSQMKRIKWDIDFKNTNQKKFWDTIVSNTINFCIGPAGCGKTYIATYWALQHLVDKNSKYDGIIITKPMVEVDGEKIGYLPGNIDEKTDPFMQSVYYNMEQIIGKQRMEVLRAAGLIKVVPLAYMRGLTLQNKIVILDEAQNATIPQIKTFLTRIGMGSKYIVSGDLMQSDLKAKGANALEDSIRRFTGLYGVGFSQFGMKDVVRHPIVAELLSRYEDKFFIDESVTAEATLSEWLTHPTYEHPKYSHYWEKN